MFPVNMYDVLSDSLDHAHHVPPGAPRGHARRSRDRHSRTATSIQEQTLIFIPKIMARPPPLVAFGPWMFGRVGDMAAHLRPA